MSLCDERAVDALGNPHPLDQYRGKVLFIANVASGCGFTPQTKGLEELHQLYAARGLVVLAFPSDDFHQEKLRGSELTACPAYQVSFPILGVTHVKGPSRDPIFTALTRIGGGLLGSGVLWNFEKFLVDRAGAGVARWRSPTAPTSGRVRRAIERELERPIP